VKSLNTPKQNTTPRSKSTTAAKKKGSIEHETYLNGAMLLMTTKLHLTRGSWEFTQEHFQECYNEVFDKYNAVTKGTPDAK